MTHAECLRLLESVRQGLDRATADARLARDIAVEAVQRLDAAMAELAAAERRHRLGSLADRIDVGSDEETAVYALVEDVFAADAAVAAATDRCQSAGCDKKDCPFLAQALARAAAARRSLGEYLVGQHLAEPDRAQSVADELLARSAVWAS